MDVQWAHISSVGMWPRSYAERNYNVVWWSTPPAGGHFPSDEVPALFVEDIRGPDSNRDV